MPGLQRITSTGRRLVLVNNVEVKYELLLCMDRAIGHDWNHNLEWRDGDDRRQGRWTYYQYLRVGRCTQCGSERIEVFETDAQNTELFKQKNRYHYSEDFLLRPKLSAGEVRMALRNYTAA